MGCLRACPLSLTPFLMAVVSAMQSKSCHGRRHLCPIAACSLLADSRRLGVLPAAALGRSKLVSGAGLQGTWCRRRCWACFCAGNGCAAVRRGLELHQGKLWRSRRAGTCFTGAQRRACAWLVHLLRVQVVGHGSRAVLAGPGRVALSTAGSVCCRRTSHVLCPGSQELACSTVCPSSPSSPSSPPGRMRAEALSTPLKSECASCPVGWKGLWLLKTVLGNTFFIAAGSEPGRK